MIYLGKGAVKTEKGEPAFRSCWECNLAHEDLKKVNTLHMCFACGRYWVFDRFLDGFDSDERFDAFFEDKGLKPGDSTTKIDAGYRVASIEMHLAEERDEK